MKKGNPEIGPLASVHPNAKLGRGVIVENFATIHGNVEIGEGTYICSGAVIFPGARIGANCKIFPGAVVAGVPQDLKFRGEETLAIIGDNTTIRECATVNRGTASKGETRVGSNCLIMAYSHVAHDCKVGNNVIMSNSTQLAGEVQVDDFAVIGGGTLVHQFCHLGSYVMIQGGALINKDIPPYVKAAREPISYAGVNVVGLRRHQFSDQQISDIQEVYRYLYLSRWNITDAIPHVIDELPDTPERDKIVDFIRNSKRGILRAGI